MASANLTKKRLDISEHLRLTLWLNLPEASKIPLFNRCGTRYAIHNKHSADYMVSDAGI
jgi:hypothetical protein